MRERHFTTHSQTAADMNVYSVCGLDPGFRSSRASVSIAGVFSISRCRQPHSHQFEQIIANSLFLCLLGQH